MSVFTALLLAACSSEPEQPQVAAEPKPAAEAPAAAVRNIDAATLKADLDGKKVPVLVDVRTPEEFAAGHVPGAKNLPIQELAGRMSELDSYKSGDVYVICQVGGRSARASEQLATAGFKAVNVDGGTSAWEQAGLPIEK
jgi:rhodanese-related sulfurtransferase